MNDCFHFWFLREGILHYSSAQPSSPILLSRTPPKKQKQKRKTAAEIYQSLKWRVDGAITSYDPSTRVAWHRWLLSILVLERHYLCSVSSEIPLVPNLISAPSKITSRLPEVLVAQQCFLHKLAENCPSESLQGIEESMELKWQFHSSHKETATVNTQTCFRPKDTPKQKRKKHLAPLFTAQDPGASFSKATSEMQHT